MIRAAYVMNLDSLAFRFARPHDIPRIVSLVNSAYRGESGKQGWTTEADLLDGQRTDEEDITQLLQTPDSMILLAEIGWELVASVHLERHEEGAYLGMLAVRPSLQGRGVGKRLMATAEDIAEKQWMAGKMLMTVINLRYELIAFYQRCGYLKTGRAKPFPASEKFGMPKGPALFLEYLEKPLGSR